MADVDAVISSLHVGPEKFQLTDQGSINKYLGLMITDIDSNSFEMSQPFLFVASLISYPLTRTKLKGVIHQLESPCSIAILTEYLINTHGYIAAQLACSVILETVSDLNFKWQSTKQLDFW